MCGGKVDIIQCFELRNTRSGKSIICGRECIVKYAIVLETMNQTPRILFPEKYRAEAERINRMRPHTITLVPKEYDEEDMRREELIQMGLDRDNPDSGELAPEGLHPEDIDWDSFDYE